MKFRRLGRTNAMVSEIGHGLWGMGGWTGGADTEASAALDESVQLGCNFFDSAWAYGDGKSDALLGSLVGRNPGTRLHLASKIPPMNLKWPADPQDKYTDVYPERHVREYVGRIRRALGGAQVDLLQLHVWDDGWIEDPNFAKTIRDLKDEGEIKWFGLSLNRWEPWNGVKAVKSGLVDVVQVIYNIFDQAPEDELFPECHKADVGIIARVPLDEGSLGGRMTRQTRFPADDWRAKYFGPENLGPTMDRVDALTRMLPDGITIPEAALRFILASPDVATTIVGMRRSEHVRQNLSVSDKGPLSADLVSALRAHRWDRRVEPWAN